VPRASSRTSPGHPKPVPAPPLAPSSLGGPGAQPAVASGRGSPARSGLPSRSVLRVQRPRGGAAGYEGSGCPELPSAGPRARRRRQRLQSCSGASPWDPCPGHGSAACGGWSGRPGASHPSGPRCLTTGSRTAPRRARLDGRRGGAGVLSQPGWRGCPGGAPAGGTAEQGREGRHPVPDPGAGPVARACRSGVTSRRSPPPLPVPPSPALVGGQGGTTCGGGGGGGGPPRMAKFGAIAPCTGTRWGSWGIFPHNIAQLEEKNPGTHFRPLPVLFETTLPVLGFRDFSTASFSRPCPSCPSLVPRPLPLFVSILIGEGCWRSGPRW